MVGLSRNAGAYGGANTCAAAASITRHDLHLVQVKKGAVSLRAHSSNLVYKSKTKFFCFHLYAKSCNVNPLKLHLFSLLECFKHILLLNFFAFFLLELANCDILRQIDALKGQCHQIFCPFFMG